MKLETRFVDIDRLLVNSTSDELTLIFCDRQLVAKISKDRQGNDLYRS